jgi:pyruvate-formate lyase-activating enzyme
MILVRNKLIPHLLFALYRKLYVKSFWKIPGSLPKIRFPYTVELELTNHCNMSCIHCHRKKMSRPLGYMDIDLFKKIIDEICTFPISFLRIVGQGESSLHPQLKTMMEYLASKDLKVEFTTNGLIFEKYSIDEILSWNIDILGISVDGVDENSYNKIRKNGNYSQLKKNVTEFYRMRNSLNIKYPILKIRNVIFPEYNKTEVDNFIRIWLQISDYINFNTFCPLDSMQNYPELYQCHAIFFDAHVRWNGMVPLCDNQCLYGQEDWLGDLNLNTLRSLWQHNRLVEVRYSHYSKDLNGLSSCKSCFKVHKNKMIMNNFKILNTSRNPMTNKLSRLINIT